MNSRRVSDGITNIEQNPVGLTQLFLVLVAPRGFRFSNFGADIAFLLILPLYLLD